MDWFAVLFLGAAGVAVLTGRAYFRGTLKRSKMACSRSAASGAIAALRSNGNSAAVSAGVSAPLAPINSPAWLP